MSVHYKFKSALEYDTVTFDGLHISVKDLKKAIIHQKRIGKNTDFDLQVTNAQTKEVYNDENALIPKNTSLVIARVPLAAQAKGKPWEGYGSQGGGPGAAGAVRPEDGALSKAVDLTQLDASEDDKIRAMMTQSTLDYDPSNYMKIRGSNQVGVVPSHYRCFKCHQPGHWIKDCPLGHGQEPMEIKKSTGIPRSFMVPVEGPMVPGAMMTPTGQYAVPVLDHQAYNEGPKPTAPAKEEKPEIPEDLLCSICKDLLTDAVMIPCCGNSFCDECIRTVLLESEDHECPDCHEKDISPGTLIPNRFLRNSVSNFKNETGYHKRQQYRNAISNQNSSSEQLQTTDTKHPTQESVVHPAESTTAEIQPVKSEVQTSVNDDVNTKPDSQTSDEPERLTDSQKPIISEADSTETPKPIVTPKEEIPSQEKVTKTSAREEGPPGVESPPTEKPLIDDTPPGVDSSPSSKKSHTKQGQAITSVGSAVNHHRVPHHISQSSSNSRSSSSHHENSVPNRHYPPPSLPSYSEQNSRQIEERPGTPTIDEPGSIAPPGYSNADNLNYPDAPPPGLHPTATTLPPSQHMHPPPQIQGPPPPSQQQNPPSGGPPPPYPLPPGGTHQPPPGCYTNAPPPGGFRMPPPGHPDYNRVGNASTGYGEQAHSMSRVLLITSLDPSVPPPNVAPTQGSFPPRPIFDPTRPPVPFDPHRPPLHGAPPPGYPSYPPGSRPTGRPFPPPRHMQPPPPGMNHRPPPHNPPNVIDDPLEAFNRMLREKDERDRRARQNRRVSRSRSYSRSRSSSRSFSRSPRSRSRTPPPRLRHRSRTRSPPPRSRRTPRSRSRSFSISRSRSFSRSPSFRGSPMRDYSPRRRPPSRYRSPMNRGTPPRYRYKERPPLHGDRNDRDRDHMPNRSDRSIHNNDRSDRPSLNHERDRDRDRDRDYPPYYDGPSNQLPPSAAAAVAASDYDYDSSYEQQQQRSSSTRQQRPPVIRNPRYGIPPSAQRKDYPPINEPYFQQDVGPAGAYPPPTPSHNNRYNPRGPNYPPPLMSVKTVPPHGMVDRPEPIPPPHRKYEDVPPPGIDQPPVPGFENQRFDNRYPPYDRARDDGPPGVDRYSRSSPYPADRERNDRDDHNREPDRSDRSHDKHGNYSRPDNNRDYRDKPPPRDTSIEKDRFERKYSPSPDRDRRRKSKSISPKRTSRDRSSPDKSRRRRRDESSEKDKRNDSRNESDREKKDRKRDNSEDEKSKKNKDKKKKREKKEADRKKRKEKKEKKEQEKLKKAEEKEKKAKEAENKEEDKKSDNEVEKDKTEPVKEHKIEGVPHNKRDIKIEKLEIKQTEQKSEQKVDLYDDMPEGIDNTVVENYGKIETQKENTPPPLQTKIEDSKSNDEEEEKEASFDGLELQANEAELKDLKTDFIETKSKSNEMLAPVPEPSKWEIEEDVPNTPEKLQLSENKSELKQVFERPGKVTSEVLKRAENAIFAKAINAIRPIEIKKISLDRAKLYSGEKSSPESIKEPVKNIQITIPGSGWNLDDIPPPGTEPVKLKDRSSKTTPPPNRLSVKERLGCKVEELDKIAKEDRRSRTLSPLSRRLDEGRNLSLGDRRVEVDERRRDDYRHRHDRRHDRNDDKDRRHRSRSRDKYRDRRQTDRKDYRRERDDRRSERSRSRHRERRHDKDDKYHDDKRDTRERERKLSHSRKSRSESRDDKDKRKKGKDNKKHKKDKEKEKEKSKKHRKEDEDDYKSSDIIVESKVISDKKHESNETKSDKIEKAKALDDRRKPTLDEANFEPDYDLETESEKEDKIKSDAKKRDRSKSEDKKPPEDIIIKKRKTEEISQKIKEKDSSSSESSESSSDERHKKKHKKHKKKKSRRDSSSSSSSSDSDSSVDKKSKKRHKSSKKLKKKKKSKHK